MTHDTGNRGLQAALSAATETIERLESELKSLKQGGQPAGVSSSVTESSGGAGRDGSEGHDYEVLVDLAPEMIVVVAPDGHILYRNTKAEGLGEEGLFPACFQDFKLVERIVEQGFVAVDQGHLYLKDGRLVLLSCAAVRFRGQEVYQYQLRDVTSASLLSDELQLIHRMAAVGTLAGEVAHAINNPLSVVMGRVELLQALPPSRLNESSRHLEVMADYARRMAHIIKGLQIFSRPGLGEIRQNNVFEVLQAARSSCNERDEAIRIELDVEPTGLSVMADPVQLVQVFDGLMSSLAAASGRRSVIQVKAREGGQGVVIGMESVNLSGAYSPANADTEWRSLDGIRDSMGFGVSVGAAILREHGGTFSIGGSEGANRCYRVELPGWSDTSEGSSLGSSVAGQRILVVEDEHGVREMAVDMLSAAGYEAGSVEDAEAGLARLDVLVFSAILVDVNLPGLSGLAFREKVLSRWPEYRTRIILMTGLDARPPPGVPMLRKPFSQASLLQAIAAAATPAS